MGAGYVRIDPAYDLRGWQGLPHALVNRATGRASFVPEAVFHTLQLCNGKFTADSPLFMGEPTWQRVAPAPADWPKIVMFSGSPPKAVMFLFTHCMAYLISRRP